jgi:hypothetical protein
MIHWMPCRNPCRLYIHLAFTYSVGPSSVVRSELGLAPPFHQWECLKFNGHGLSVSCVKWPWVSPILFVSLNTDCRLHVQCHQHLHINLVTLVVIPRKERKIGRDRFTMLQLLSLATWLSIQIWSIPWWYLSVEILGCRICRIFLQYIVVSLRTQPLERWKRSDPFYGLEINYFLMIWRQKW